MASATDGSGRAAGGKAAGGPRAKRPTPARTHPDRGVGGRAEFGSPGEAPADPPPADPPPAGALARDVEQLIADAVALGYAVVGDNLAHGRSVATRLSQGSYRLNHAADDVSSAGQRLLKLAGDMGRVWLDLVGAVARDPDLHAALRREHPRGAEPTPTPWAFTTDARGHRRVRVHPLVLDMSSSPRGLACPALNDQAGASAPITRVEWIVSPAARHVTAIIDVPENQPAGHYAGAVRTAPGGRVVGTLSLEVEA